VATLKVRHPPTEELLDTVPNGDADETREAIDAAHAARPGSRGTPAWKRSRSLRAAAAALRAEAPRITKILTRSPEGAATLTCACSGDTAAGRPASHA